MYVWGGGHPGWSWFPQVEGSTGQRERVLRTGSESGAPVCVAGVGGIGGGHDVPLQGQLTSQELPGM